MTANTPRSRKSKGAKFQKWIAEELRAVTSGLLEDDDIKTAIMGESGRDIKLSPLGKKVIPFDIEAKRTEKLNLWGSLKQAEENSEDGRIPLLVFSMQKIYWLLHLKRKCLPE